VYHIEIRPTLYTPNTNLNPSPPISSRDEICKQTRDFILRARRHLTPPNRY